MSFASELGPSVRSCRLFATSSGGRRRQRAYIPALPSLAHLLCNHQHSISSSSRASISPSHHIAACLSGSIQLFIAQASHLPGPLQLFFSFLLFAAPRAATMPLAERDVNSQHHQSSTRAKRLPAAGHENAPPSSNTSGVRVTPARQRFFAATKASAAKTSPPSSADRTRQPHSNNTTPHSQTPGSRLPCRNVAAPKLTPPSSKWNPTSARRFNHLENTSEDAQVSPCAREAPQTADQSLVCECTCMPCLKVTNKPNRLTWDLRPQQRITSVQASLCHPARSPRLLTDRVPPRTVAALLMQVKDLCAPYLPAPSATGRLCCPPLTLPRHLLLHPLLAPWPRAPCLQDDFLLALPRCWQLPWTSLTLPMIIIPVLNSRNPTA